MKTNLLKLKTFMIAITVLTLIAGCTKNARVRTFGGTQIIELKENQRLVNITWKDNDLWVLTKPDTIKPVEYTFKESSSLGVLEGTIIIKEK